MQRNKVQMGRGAFSSHLPIGSCSDVTSAFIGTRGYCFWGGEMKPPALKVTFKKKKRKKRKRGEALSASTPGRCASTLARKRFGLHFWLI